MTEDALFGIFQEGFEAGKKNASSKGIYIRALTARDCWNDWLHNNRYKLALLQQSKRAEK